jgi:hypothetical protein
LFISNKLKAGRMVKRCSLFGCQSCTIPSILVLRAHFKSHAILKYTHLLGMLALNMLITSINFSLLPSFTLHAHE